MSSIWVKHFCIYKRDVKQLDMIPYVQGRSASDLVSPLFRLEICQIISHTLLITRCHDDDFQTFRFLLPLVRIVSAVEATRSIATRPQYTGRRGD